VICGTRGIPGTVAPFRAWRGSRDLVAQSPKFHAPAVAPRSAQLQTKSLAQRREREQSRSKFSGLAEIKSISLPVQPAPRFRNSINFLWTPAQIRVL
jgi:hypothetical protein